VSKWPYLIFSFKGLKKRIWLCATCKAKSMTLAIQCIWLSG